MADIKYRDANLSDLGRIVEIYNTTIPSRMVTADPNWHKRDACARKGLITLAMNRGIGLKTLF